jgi:hypothetical protein
MGVIGRCWNCNRDTNDRHGGGYLLPYRNALGWRWVLLPIAFALLYLVGIVIHATLDLPAGGAMDVSP